MNCPKCGGRARHIVTDTRGNNYYQCGQGLTSFQRVDGQMTRDSRIVQCGCILNAQGKPLTGSVVYNTGDKLKTLSARDGVEVR